MFHAVPPAVRAIFRDKRLSDFDKVVFMIVAERLDFVEYRELTLSSVAADVGVGRDRSPGRSTIHRSLQRITGAGYLHREDTTDPRQPSRFRLRFSLLVGRNAVPLGATATDVNA